MEVQLITTWMYNLLPGSTAYYLEEHLTIWENSSLLGRKAHLLGEQFTTLENKNCLTVLDYSLLRGRLTVLPLRTPKGLTYCLGEKFTTWDYRLLPRSADPRPSSITFCLGNQLTAWQYNIVLPGRVQIA